MASRRALGATDADRFISSDVQQRCNEVFNKKILVPEREFFKDWAANAMGVQLEQTWGVCLLTSTEICVRS